MATKTTARYRLCLLGPWELTAADGKRIRSVLAQPKRLCLLAYLAFRAEPVTRASLVALFWPHADESRGRNALSQSLHHLRRSLGPGVIESVEGDRIHVSRSSVAFDARELLDGELEPSLGGEVGDFFEGWNAEDSQPLQEWVDRTRRELREAAAARILEPASPSAPRGADGSEPGPEAAARVRSPEESARRTAPARRRSGWYAAGAVATLALVARIGIGAAPPAHAEGSAVVVLAPLVMHGDPVVPLSEAAVHAELVNQLVERLGPGRVVPAAFAQTSQEFERLLTAQADVPRGYRVVETVVRVDGRDARLTATLLDPGGYGRADGSTSGDFVLRQGGDGLIDVPRAIAATVAERFAPLLRVPPE